MFFTWMILGGLLFTGAVAVYQIIVSVLNRLNVPGIVSKLLKEKAPQDEKIKKALSNLIKVQVTSILQQGNKHVVKLDALSDERLCQIEITCDSVGDLKVNDVISNINV